MVAAIYLKKVREITELKSLTLAEAIQYERPFEKSSEGNEKKEEKYVFHERTGKYMVVTLIL